MGFNHKIINKTLLTKEFENEGSLENLFKTEFTEISGIKTINFVEEYRKKGLTSKLKKKLKKWSLKKK